MDNSAPEGLIEHFSKLEDPRVERNKKHELIDVIVLCVCASASRGAEGWCDIEEFKAERNWTGFGARMCRWSNGIPVEDLLRLHGIISCVVGEWVSRNASTPTLDGRCWSSY